MAIFLLQALAIAVFHELFQRCRRIAVQDAVDGIVSRDVLNLATAEVVLLGQGTNV